MCFVLCLCVCVCFFVKKYYRFALETLRSAVLCCKLRLQLIAGGDEGGAGVARVFFFVFSFRPLKTKHGKRRGTAAAAAA